MRLFHNDYNAMCHPAILQKMQDMAPVAVTSYGLDPVCEKAAGYIRQACQNPALSVHFLSGGTQTNLTVIAAALRPHQAVIAAASGHISEHETGAIEATGHKVLELPASDGKITASQVEKVVLDHYSPDGPGGEHMPQPKMVYISQPTELGTLYTLNELESLAETCQKYGLDLYADGARLGYGLTAPGNDITLPDMARLCDVFYIGGTKVGAMFGEAVVIRNPSLSQDFRYFIKQRGGMLAKGWLLGLQFEALFENGLYFTISRLANGQAQQIRDALKRLGYPLVVDSPTNQVFTVMSDGVLARLEREFSFTNWCRVDPEHRMIRFCTSWATRQEDTDALCDFLEKITK